MAAGLRIGGITPFTSIDFPGRLSAVLFVQGCPWRCTYCHNPHLQSRGEPTDKSWAEVMSWLKRRQGLLDAVVFSGGEPTVDPMLGPAMGQVGQLAYEVGLHTAGTHPGRLRSVLPLTDWVGIDVKAPLHDAEQYDRITGRSGSARLARQCLEAVLTSGKRYEVRTTIHPNWLGEDHLLKMGQELSDMGVQNWVWQMGRSTAHLVIDPVYDYPTECLTTQMQRQFAAFSIRSD